MTPTTFSQLPVGTRFVMADSPGGAVKIKIGFESWTFDGYAGFLPVAVGCRGDREVIVVEGTKEATQKGEGTR